MKQIVISQAQLSRKSPKLTAKSLRQWGQKLVGKGHVKRDGIYYIVQVSKSFDKTAYMIGRLSDNAELLSKFGEFSSPTAAITAIKSL